MRQDYTHSVAWILETRQPSGRKHLRELLQTPEGLEQVDHSLRAYLGKWVEADWLDEGDVFYLGQMMAAFADEFPALPDAVEGILKALGESGQAQAVIKNFREGYALGSQQAASRRRCIGECNCG